MSFCTILIEIFDSLALEFTALRLLCVCVCVCVNLYHGGDFLFVVLFFAFGNVGAKLRRLFCVQQNYRLISQRSI